jgi:hypothetical protein
MGPGVFTLPGDPRSFFRSKPENNCDLYGQISFYSASVNFLNTERLWSSILEADRGSLARLEKALIPAKKTTITCVKGKLIKKVTAVSPKCPAGYKKK